VVPAQAAWTQPRIAVNDALPPAVVAANAGGTAAVVVSGGPANTTDWIAFYPVGAADTGYLAWQYLSGTTSPPGVGLSTAALTFGVPVSPGDYEFRLFANNGFTRLATSTVVTVAASSSQIAVNGGAPGSPVEVSAGGEASVVVSGGPANREDWIGLFAVGAPDASHLAWQYLSGTTSPPATGMSGAVLTFDVPVVAGAYELRFFANNGYARLATSGVITVLPSQARIIVNGITPPATISAVAGSDAVVVISDGPGNRTDWLGLYAVGAADTAPISWRYLNGTTAPPATGVTGATIHVAVHIVGSPGAQDPVAEFQRAGVLAGDLIGLWRDLKKHNQVLLIGFTNADLSEVYGGARTRGLQSAPIGARDLCGPLSQRPCILINTNNVAVTDACHTGSTSVQCFNLRKALFEGQDQNPAWYVRHLFLNGLSDRPIVALWHELGHAKKVFNGGTIPDGAVINESTNQEALFWENRIRLLIWGACGPDNARKVRHGPNLTQWVTDACVVNGQPFLPR
jgi:hypothetical protein